MVLVKVCPLYSDSKIPTKGSSGAAGFDLYAHFLGPEVVVIDPGVVRAIRTGVAMAIPEGYCGKIFARSGLALRQGLRPANCTGIVDSDYRGEIIVPLYNDSNTEQVIENGERIGQMIFEKVEDTELSVVDSLDETKRGKGGFGSTGAK